MYNYYLAPLEIMNMFENYSDYEKEMLQSAHDAISQLESWDFMKNYEPPEDRGFMWDSNERVIKIMNKVNELYGGHSGASLAWTMRIMQKMAREGTNVSNVQQ